MELDPLQVTQFAASHSSCKASGSEADAGTPAASILMKTKRVCRSTRASWMALSRPEPRQGSEEVGTRSTVRLCSMHSSTASATAARRGQTVLIQRYSSHASSCSVLTCARCRVPIIQAQAVAKALLQNTRYPVAVRFLQNVRVRLVAHQKDVVALSIYANESREQKLQNVINLGLSKVILYSTEPAGSVPGPLL